MTMMVMMMMMTITMAMTTTTMMMIMMMIDDCELHIKSHKRAFAFGIYKTNFKCEGAPGP